MAATDATGFPSKNQLFRHYFVMRDNVGAPITAAWTGTATGGKVILDGDIGGIFTIPLVQISGSHWGYIELSAAQMNGSAACLTCTITNANAVAYDVVINPIDTTPKALANPSTLRLPDMIAQDWNYIFGRVTNDGSNLKMYAVDGTTQLAVMSITGQIDKGKAY